VFIEEVRLEEGLRADGAVKDFRGLVRVVDLHNDFGCFKFDLE
jgi:hypothetical protein